MEAWLRALIDAIPFPFRAPAELIVGAVIRVYQWTYGLFRRVRDGWNPISAAAQWLSGGINELARETWTTFQHLILVKIPQWASHAIAVTVQWAADRINATIDYARGLVGSAIEWAGAQLRAALAALDTLRHWTVDRVAELVSAVNRLLGRVFGDWASPARLAEWLAGAMWSALWRYGYGQVDRLATTLWAARTTLALRAVTEAERILGRIL